MPLQQADIRFARSVNMADVPEGGGPPSAHLIPDGASNTIVTDVREEDRDTLAEVLGAWQANPPVWP